MAAAVEKPSQELHCQKYQRRQAHRGIFERHLCDDRWRRRARPLMMPLYCGKRWWDGSYLSPSPMFPIMWKKIQPLDEGHLFVVTLFTFPGKWFRFAECLVERFVFPWIQTLTVLAMVRQKFRLNNKGKCVGFKFYEGLIALTLVWPILKVAKWSLRARGARSRGYASVTLYCFSYWWLERLYHTLKRCPWWTCVQWSWYRWTRMVFDELQR